MANNDDDDRRTATDDPQRAHAIATARDMVQTHGATHECAEWLHAGACALCDRIYRTLVVGDVVHVARECGGNPLDSHAVVVQIYDRQRQRGDQSGVMLLFRNGFYDGFSPEDVDLFGVTLERHEPTLARYTFVISMDLIADYRAGRFAAVWTPGCDCEQNGQTDPEYHASDCTWRMRTT